MYYLNENKDGSVSLLSNIKTERDLENDIKFRYKLVGQFGRLDYAMKWFEYKNGIMSNNELRLWLNN